MQFFAGSIRVWVLNTIYTLLCILHKMLLKQDKIKFFTFLPFIVTTATVFPGLTLNDSGEQPQIFSGISTGTSRTEKDHTVHVN